jgi:hypothetical protein
MRQALQRGRADLATLDHFSPVLRETRPDIVAHRYLDFYNEVLAARQARAA